MMSRKSIKQLRREYKSKAEREKALAFKRSALVPMIKKVVRSEAEKKTFDDNFAVSVSTQGTTAGSQGAAIMSIGYPAVGDNQNQRSGREIRIVAWSVKAIFTNGVTANTIVAYPMRVYLVKYKDGTTPQLNDFLDDDPNFGTRITMASHRNMNQFTDFQVLAIKDIILEPDQYAAAGTCGYLEMAIKCDIPVRFTGTGTTPNENSLHIIMTAATGDRSANTHATAQVNSRYWFTDL